MLLLLTPHAQRAPSWLAASDTGQMPETYDSACIFINVNSRTFFADRHRERHEHTALYTLHTTSCEIMPLMAGGFDVLKARATIIEEST